VSDLTLPEDMEFSDVSFAILHLSQVDSKSLFYAGNISEVASCLVQTVVLKRSPVCSTRSATLCDENRM
jgi:hypothetical protein